MLACFQEQSRLSVDVSPLVSVRHKVMNEFWDRLGISASMLCIVHCLLTPAVVLFSPLVGEWMSAPAFHAVIVIIVVPIALWALWRGYTQHKQKRVLILGVIGIALIFGAIWVGHENKWETVLMICAGVLLSLAHLSNLHSCRIASVKE